MATRVNWRIIVTYLDEQCLIAPNAVDLAHSVYSEQRAQLRGRPVQRGTEWGVAALEDEVIRYLRRLPADRDVCLQNEQVVEVSGVELAERESHLLLSHRRREALQSTMQSSASALIFAVITYKT